MRLMVIFLLLFSLWGSDANFRAYLTSTEFEVVGQLYAYDFDRNGVIANDEYLLLKQKRLYHINLKEGFEQDGVLIDLALEKTSFVGYIVKDPNKAFYLLLRFDGGVSSYIPGGCFDSLDSELGFEIENGFAAVVYKNFAAFENIVASYDTPGFAWSVSIEGDKLLVADAKEGVIALDKELEELLWSFKDDGSLLCLLPLGGDRYALGTSDGLHIFQKESFTVIKQFFTGHYVSKFVDEGKSFLALVERDGIYRIQKDSLKVQKVAQDIRDPQDFCLLGDALVVADGDQGVVLLSQQISRLSDRNDIKAIAALNKEDVVLLPWQSKSLLLYKRNAKKVIELPQPATIAAIRVLKNGLYLLYEEAYVDQIKIGRNGAFLLQKRFFLPYPATDIVEDEEFLYVTIGGAGVIRIVK